MSQTPVPLLANVTAETRKPVSTLKYDPEFAAVTATTLIPPPPPGTIAERRAFADKAFGDFLKATRPPLARRVTQRTHYAAAHDGYNVPIFHFSARTTRASKPASAILYIHGGGMIMGSVPVLTPLISDMVISTGLDVFAVELSLDAYEYPHPTLVEDSYAGLVWLRDHAADFDVDPSRVVVYGESAGGGIAAGITLMARDRHFSPPIAKQVLVFPMLDDRDTVIVPERAPFATWTYEDNLMGWSALLREGVPGAAEVSQYAAPARATNLAGLPPTLIDVGELDIFRDENMEYARRIAGTGTSVEFHLYPGVPHGFDVVAPNIDVAQRARMNKIRALTSV